MKNGANLLDRLVKDIVTESEYFDVDMFIPLLHKYIRMTNPYIRQLLVRDLTLACYLQAYDCSYYCVPV